jgi:4-hydroxy-2-oxoglutarate aldolase
MPRMNLTGVLAPIPTPFDDLDRLDLARLRAALPRWVNSPLAGIVVLGSTGEAALMDEDESERTIAATREAVPRERVLIAGTGRESTRATINASRRAAELGADAVLVRTPAFFKSQMTADVFVRHYTAVADRSPVPVLLYNFTAVTGVNLPVDAVGRLAEHPNIAGLKESGGDVGQIADFVAAAPPGFCVLAGSASTFYASLCVGAGGGILALAVLLPGACVRLFERTRAGQHDAARALQHQLVPLARLIGAKYGVAGLKAALSVAGCDVGRPRSPLAPAPEPAVAALKEALARIEEIAA